MPILCGKLSHKEIVSKDKCQVIIEASIDIKSDNEEQECEKINRLSVEEEDFNTPNNPF